MSRPRALRLYAGPAALRHVHRHGVLPQHVGVIPAAAGGPKGLMLLRLDRFLFGHWLPRSTQPVQLVGASIGAWRLATACLPDALAALARLEHEYIHEEFRTDGQTRRRLPPPETVSATFARTLDGFFGGREQAVLDHPRFRLHVVTAHGRWLLARERRGRTAVGYAVACASNVADRQALGIWLERVVFSSTAPGAAAGALAPLPFAADGFPTRQCALDKRNFRPVLQASGSIPFVLRAVHDIPGAPPGAYWDGGITDYHLHLRYLQHTAAPRAGADGQGALVLYPHFQRAVVPGWLDKALRWRHRSTAALDHVLLLAPDPDWVRALPGGKLPDRTDFTRHHADPAARIRLWTAAVAASQQLADEWAEWLHRPDPTQIEPL